MEAQKEGVGYRERHSYSQQYCSTRHGTRRRLSRYIPYSEWSEVTLIQDRRLNSLGLSFTHSNTAFSIVGAIALSLLVVAAGLNAQASTQIRPAQQTSTPNGGVLNGQSYSGMMMGGLLWEDNSFPFQNYASNSSILALPAISSWLSSNGYTPSDLRPYLSMYPSQGNPYDFSQGGVTVNGTSYNVY